MANESRKSRNPYLFILLKRMLEYEFVRLAKRISSRELAQHISRRENEQHKKSWIKKWKKSSPETLRKEVLGTAIFFFSENILNRLARQVTVIDSFHSWEDFCNKYGDDEGAQTAQEKFMVEDFATIAADDKHNIYGWVEQRILELHFKRQRDDQEHNPSIIRNTQQFIIRNPNKRELREEVELNRNIKDYACDWYDKNKNHFFIYLDNYRIRGFINILALKGDSVKPLLGGYIKYPFIPAAHLHSPDAYAEINHIHIFQFQCLQQKVCQLILNDFETMLRTISGVPDNELILSIVKQPDAVSVWDKYNFRKSGWVFDINFGVMCSFYETTWHSLKQQLNHEVDIEYSPK